MAASCSRGATYVKQLGKQQITPLGTTVVFAAAPAIVAGSTLLIAAIAPLVATGSPLDSSADLFAVVGLLFVGTVALTLAGIDTGTSFGGMGASREITIAALVEPTILLAVFALSIPAGSANLGALVANTITHPEQVVSVAAVLAFAALVIVIVAETGRLPVDNPATHLELTMVHEAMVLEYAGPRLALVEWAAGMRLTVLLALLANLFAPWGIAGGQPSAIDDRRRRRSGGGQGRRAGGAARNRRGVRRQTAAVPGSRAAGRVISTGVARGHRRQLLHGAGMTYNTFTVLVDLAAGGLILAAVLIVWRRDLAAIVRLLAWQGVALAAIPILRGVYDSDGALIGVGVAVLVLRAAVLPRLLARAVGAEPRSHREATPLVNTATSLLITAALTLAAFAATRPVGEPAAGGLNQRGPGRYRGGAHRAVGDGHAAARGVAGRGISDAGQRNRRDRVPAHCRGATDRRTRRLPGRAVRSHRDRRSDRPAVSHLRRRRPGRAAGAARLMTGLLLAAILTPIGASIATLIGGWRRATATLIVLVGGNGAGVRRGAGVSCRVGDPVRVGRAAARRRARRSPC